jgi:hypothetical protein
MYVFVHFEISASLNLLIETAHSRLIISSMMVWVKIGAGLLRKTENFCFRIEARALEAAS